MEENGSDHEDETMVTQPMVNGMVQEKKDLTIASKKRGIYINLAVICIVWFFIFSPYMALEVLQSSLNPTAGLGVTAISVLYATKIISSFFGPLIIHKLTAKWTLVIGWICHTLFVAANYYPNWWTLVSAGVLVGATVGPIWICNGVYITTLASEMAEYNGKQKGAVLSQFYGIFGLIPPSTSIFGNFLSSFILKSFATDHDSYELISNFTSLIYTSNDTSVELKCGANYCPYQYDDYLQDRVKYEKTHIPKADPTAVYILLTIYLVMSILGTLITIFFLRNVKDTSKLKEKENSFCSNLLANFKSLMDYKLLILVPVFFFMFMRRATVNASFTKAFITCTLGIDMVGYVMAVRGLASIVTSYISGHIGQKIHRNYQFLVACVLWLGVTATWLLWEPQESQLWAFFVIAIVAGMVNSIDIVQFQAFMGANFSNKKAEAFAAQNVWSGIAMAAVFAYSSHLCFSIQVFILTGILALSIFGYLTLYFHLRSQEAKYKATSQKEI